jgi:hypothetical protein
MLWNQAVGHTRLAGGVALVLAALGAPAIFARTPAVRRLAVRGLVLTVLAQALMVGRAYLVHGVAVPMPLALLAASPLRFFRYPFRFVVVLGFGATLLGAAALEAVRRRLGRGAGAAAAAAVALAVLATRGPALVEGGFEDFAVQRNPVYGAVREAARADGAGPLLELPVIGFMQDARHAGVGTEAESMVGSTRHWLPLVVGYTDFPPPHRRFLDRTLRRLPASEALDLVVDMTGLRWCCSARRRNGRRNNARSDGVSSPPRACAGCGAATAGICCASSARRGTPSGPRPSRAAGDPG